MGIPDWARNMSTRRRHSSAVVARNNNLLMSIACVANIIGDDGGVIPRRDCFEDGLIICRYDVSFEDLRLGGATFESVCVSELETESSEVAFASIRDLLDSDTALVGVEGREPSFFGGIGACRWFSALELSVVGRVGTAFRVEECLIRPGDDGTGSARELLGV